MLLNLHVKNFAIIDEADVTFRDNLNILTGETGAGKSIIIGSINAALGGKISKDIIRKGADYALVELVFQTEGEEVAAKLKELDLSPEEGQVIISRKIMNGKSISKINGETVTAGVLKEIAGLLLDIHGQHEHQSLLYKDKHLEIVDRFAKDSITHIKKDLESEYREYISLKNQIQELQIDEDKRLREISFLEYERNEILTASLKEGEDDVLASEFKKLSNAKIITDSLGGVYERMNDQFPASVGDNISRTVKSLAKLTDFDQELSQLYKQILDIDTLISDFNRDLSEYMSNMNNYEEELFTVEKRLDQINHLKSKYGGSIPEIIKYCNENEKKLEQYNHYEETMEDMNTRLIKVEERIKGLSQELSGIRKNKAAELTEKIKGALIDLNFLDVQFEMLFKVLDHFTANGFDEGEFLISTNPGEEIKPLSKVASGGELSRIMLAIKSVLADKDDINTLIFDEIDVGVSGRTAQKVSEKLSMIAGNHQVLCITHLPQIAAMADSHYIIEKSTDGISTVTSIRNLTEDESVSEIARILGGAIITDTVMQSAKEMKELAKTTKIC